jgi:hypothetical protein
MEELKVNGANLAAAANQPPSVSWLQCPLCNLNFNCKGRLPIYMICCGETACLECVETKMNKGQQRGVSIKGKFLCAFCESDHCAPAGVN